VADGGKQGEEGCHAGGGEGEQHPGLFCLDLPRQGLLCRCHLIATLLLTEGGIGRRGCKLRAYGEIGDGQLAGIIERFQQVFATLAGEIGLVATMA